MIKKFIFFLCAFGFASIAVADPLVAELKQSQIEIVVPNPPGGTASNTAQLVAAVLKDQGYRVVVTNKPGNNGIIAANHVAAARPNGQTLLLGGTSTMAANLAFRNEQTGMEYTERSFVPIVLTGQSAMGLIVSATAPFRTYEQFKQYVRENPQRFNIGTWNASFGSVFKEWARREGLPAPTLINYKGSAPMVVDIVNGNLLAAFDNIGWGASAVPLIADGKMSLLATLDNSVSRQVRVLNARATDLALLHPRNRFSVWNGLFAPVGTPPAVIAELNRAVNTALADTQHRASAEEMSLGGRPDVLRDLWNRDLNLLKSLNQASQ